MINNRFSGTLDVPSSSNVVYHLLGLVINLFYLCKNIEYAYRRTYIKI
jgi:hypothetical protein